MALLNQVKTLNIIQHNVRDWKTQKISLCNSYYQINPDIILLGSHGLSDVEELKIFNYYIHKINNSQNKHDGTAIAIKRNIQYKLLDDFNEFLAIQITTTMGDIILATTYLPPRRPYLPIQDIFKLCNSNLPTYILGDFNARHRIFGYQDNNNVGIGFQTLIDMGKLIHLGPNFSTFIGHRTLTTPDRIFTNNKAFLNYAIQQGPITTSDHIPILFTLSTSPIQTPCNPRFQMSRADWPAYQQELLNYETSHLQDETLEKIDDEIDRFHNTVKLAVQHHIPITHYKTLPHNKITDNIRRLQVQFNNTLQYIQRHGPSIEQLRHIRTLQHTLQEETKQIHNTTWNNLLLDIDQDLNPKTFWQSINKLMGNNKKHINYLKDQNGKKLFTDEEKESAFRIQWAKVFKISEEENIYFDQEHENKIKRDMQQYIYRISPYHTVDLNKFMLLKSVNYPETLHNLRKFKEKTPGLTGLTRNMLINLPRNAILALTNIYNASLSAGYFPDVFKKAKIIFIPKPGKDPTDIMNYRPISLLDVTAKLFEKIINERLIKFLIRNNKYNPRQHGFREGRGTQTAIALITELIAMGKIKGNQVNVVSRDISKAFDKVWHLGLQYKLINLGLPDLYTRILCDYITDRTAQIQIGNYLGPSFPLEAGVPQGGVLSPNLFLIYTGDLPTPTQHSEHIIFADDITQIINYPGKSPAMMAAMTSNAIKNINTFEHKWKIQTNPNKFKIVPIMKKKLEPIIVDDEHYPYSDNTTTLGLKITRNGYSTFFTEKKHKAQAALTNLKRFKNMSSKTKQKLYTTLIKPILEYPPIPIHTQTKTNLLSLQRIQNKALRFVHNTHYTDRITNEDLHCRSGLETLNVTLHNRAINIWNTIEQQQEHTFIENIQNPQDNEEIVSHYKERQFFVLSRPKSKQPTPPPLYK